MLLIMFYIKTVIKQTDTLERGEGVSGRKLKQKQNKGFYAG